METGEPRDCSNTFLLGLGAQKAGTTWLARYIGKFDEANLGRFKEYHVWDGLDVPECRHWHPGPRQFLTSTRALQRRLFQSFPSAYFRHFERLLAARGVRITGDITPSYSGLPEARLRYIRDRFEERGIRCKALFMMRDPLERCWSAVRMARRLGAARGHAQVDPADEASELRAYYVSNDAAFRTHYDLCLGKIEAVFDPDDLYTGLFENFTTPEELTRFSEFLGLEPRFEGTGEKTNVSPKTDALSPDLEREIVLHFREVYEFCADRFPMTKQLWRGFQYLDS